MDDGELFNSMIQKIDVSAGIGRDEIFELGRKLPHAKYSNFRQPFIIDTDLGHDPDDLFAISYLILAGYSISHICLTPGSPYQVQLARMICRELGCDARIIANKPSENHGYGKMYTDLLRLYPISDDKPDCYIYEIDKVEPSDLVLLGAAKNCSKLDCDWQNITIQGGFCPYSLHEPTKIPKLDKFVGLNSCPSYNPNGDRKGFELIANTPCGRRLFVTKNVCHTVEVDRTVMGLVENTFVLNAFEYLFRYTNTKKMHDLLAAVVHGNRMVCDWVQGKVIKANTGWTTEPHYKGSTDNEWVSVDFDKDKFYEELKRVYSR